MSTATRFLGLGAAFGLAAGLLAGVSMTQPGRAAGAAPSPNPGAAVGTGAIVAPVAPVGPITEVPPASPTVNSGGTVAGQAGAAIAYPYFGGTPGVAPDHTIVVTGVGQTDVQSDGSDRASAQRKGLAAAIADARAQADAIASDTGLSISGVLSVGASVSPGYGVEPLAGTGSSAPACIGAVPGGAPNAGGTTVVPQPACPPAYPQILSVSVTVEYQVR